VNTSNRLVSAVRASLSGHGRLWRTTGFLVVGLAGCLLSCDDGPARQSAGINPGTGFVGRRPSGPPAPPGLVDTGTDVGALPAKYYVGANGEFSYVVPLWTPTGRKEIEPDLSLTYSSRGSESEMGLGWTVRGLGEIRRCSHASSRLERPAPLHWDAEAHFCLNGAPLVLVSGSNAEQGAEYRTEPDTFAKITVLRADPLGPLEFEVRSREGRIHRYGSEDDARVEGQKVSWAIDQAAARSAAPLRTFQKVRFSWLHATTEDRHRNRIEIQYQHPAEARQEGGFQEPLPRTIDYVFTNGAPTRRVVFSYQARSEPASVRREFVAGLEFRRTQLLEGIEMQAPSDGAVRTVRHYRFAYETSPATRRPLLSTIEECDGNPRGATRAVSCKRPTTFSYDPGSSELVEHRVAAPDTRQPGLEPFWGFQTADIDNDGRDDLVYRAMPRGQSNPNWYYRSSTGTGFGAPIEMRVGDKGQLTDLVLVDLDQDGFVDAGRADPATRTVRYFRNVGGNFQPFPESTPTDESAKASLLTAVQIGDYSGKARLSIMRPRNDGRWGYRSLVAGQIGGVSDPLDLAFDPAGSPTVWNGYNVDLDNDGALELLGLPVSAPRNRLRALIQQDVPLSAPGGGDDSSHFATRDTTLLTAVEGEQIRYYFADLNGDGLSDAIRLIQGGEALDTLLNSGAGFAPPVRHDELLGTSANVRVGPGAVRDDLQDPGLQTLDFDGDGRRDIILFDNGAVRDRSLAGNTATRSNVTVLLSRGDRFEPLTTAIPIGAPAEGKTGLPGSGPLHDWKQSRLLDANGDGLLDLVQVDQDGTIRLALRQGKRADLLLAVKDGMGKKLDVTFAPMSDPETYRPGSGCVFPQHCARRGLWLVKSYREDNGIGADQNEQRFRYEDGRTDLEGAGFLGFGKTTRIDLASSTTTVETYDLAFKERVPPLQVEAGAPTIFSRRWVPQVRVVETNDRGTIRRNTSTSTGELVLSNGGATYYFRALSYRLVDEEVRAAGSKVLRTVERTLRYRPEENDYGLLATEQTRTSSDAGELVEVTSNDFDNRPGPWLIGLLRTNVHEGQANGKRESRTTTYERSGLTGEVEAFTVGEAGQDTYLKTRFTRNGFGQVIATRYEATDRGDGSASVREESVGFDEDSVHPRTMTNSLGHVSTIVSNPVFGLPESLTHPGGAVTTYNYDRFGRRRRINHPGGGGVSWSYRRDVEEGSRSADERFVMKVVEEVDGGGEYSSVHNRLNQVIRRESRNLGGKVSYSNAAYNDLGFLASYTRRALVGSPPGPSTQIDYDELARVTARTRPEDGEGAGYGTAVASAGFEERTVTTTDDMGRTQRIVENEVGRVVRTELRNDAGQWVPTTFTYHPWGLVESVVRRDGAGEASQTVTAEYDSLGRRTKLVDPDAGTTTFAFNGFGDVREETDGNGRVTTYVRDALGRVTERRDPDGVTGFVFDSAEFGTGQLAESTSPTGVRRQFFYDRFGRMRAQTWTVGGADYRMEYGYDPHGRLETLSYPETPRGQRLVVRQEYDPYSGQMFRVSDERTGKRLWEARDSAPDGQLSEELFGNDLSTRYGFSERTGRLASIRTAKAGEKALLRDYAYDYWADGNLLRQSDHRANQHERFEFDASNRIRRWVRADAEGREQAGGWKVDYGFDDFGNHTWRRFTPGKQTGGEVQDVRFEFQAGSDRLLAAPWGAFEYDGRGQQVRRPGGETIDYTMFGLPKRIDGPRAATFQYDANGQRVEKRRSESDFTVYLPGFYEKRTSGADVQHVFYVQARSTIVAQVLRAEGSGKESTLFLHTDRLGSVDSVSNEEGKVVERSRRDPFGNRVEDFNRPVLPGAAGKRPTGQVRLGFTGHEQDDDIGLVNMGGRLYDARLGRFITPDPLIREALHGPSYNRYSYALNNPLRNVDPTGFSEVEVDAATARELEQAGFECTGSGSTVTCDDGGGVEEITIVEESECKPYYIECRDDDDNGRSDTSSSGGGGGGGVSTPTNSDGSEQKSEDKQETEDKNDTCEAPKAAGGADGSSLLDKLQVGLDVASLGLDATGVGAAVSWLPDLVNAGISLGRGDYAGAGLSIAAAIPGVGVAGNIGRLGRAAANAADAIPPGASRLGPNAPPQRYQGPWTQEDLARAQNGQGPLDMVPDTDSAGRQQPLQVHHADQMPGSGVHEVSRVGHRETGLHPNRRNQGVTDAMRRSDREQHWKYRGQEMGNPPTMNPGCK
jgi:RHS repeat-associated protein